MRSVTRFTLAFSAISCWIGSSANLTAEAPSFDANANEVILVSNTVAETEDSEKKHALIFDGKSFEGWEGDLEWFRIDEGAIVDGSLERDIPHNQFLCTKERFRDFELILEVKLRGEGNNAGVQFRSKRIPDSTEVIGYQCDVGVAWDRNVWGCLYDESRRNKMLAEDSNESITKLLKEGEWNELKIRAIGKKIELFLNGTRTVLYEEEDSSIERDGFIGLQIHSGPPTEALYRNIRIERIAEK